MAMEVRVIKRNDRLKCSIPKGIVNQTLYSFSMLDACLFKFPIS
jgi:hypothetical protein